MRNLIGLATAVGLCVGAIPAQAIMSGQESKLAPSSDPDYAAGKAAFIAGDWEAAIANLTLVLINRPWHDNAETMIGHAWRRLGNYDESLKHYEAALALNPRNRGALEYMGEAYLDLGRVDDAVQVAVRLADLCHDVVMGFTNNGWISGCEELAALEKAFKSRNIPIPTQ
ncbi:MAG: tetratricopeptide repeat protein [Geminicoccaceae bacterium]